MRAIFIVLICSVLSILAVKYLNNGLNQSVPLATPATAASL